MALVRCPRCQVPLKVAALTTTANVRCLRCKTTFDPRPLMAEAEAITPATAVQEAPLPQPQTRKQAPAGNWPSRAIVLVGAAVVGCMCLGGGLLTACLTWFVLRSQPDVATPAASVEQPIVPTKALEAPPAVAPEMPQSRRTLKPPETPSPVLAPGASTQHPHLVLDSGGHSSTVWSVFLTPDAHQVVTVSADKTVRVFDSRNGDVLRVWRLPVGPGKEGALYAGALSRDGKRLAVGGASFGNGAHGYLIYILSLANGAIERVLKGHSDAITSLAFSVDGRYLASGSLDKTARIYETETGRFVTALPSHPALVRSLAFAPDGRRLVTLTKQGCQLWSIPEAGRLAELPPRTGDYLDIAWAPDGDSFSTSTAGGFIHLWGSDGAWRRSLAVLPDEKVQTTSVKYSPDGQELLYTGIGRGNRAGMLELKTGRARPFNGHTNTVLAGALSTDGRLAVTSGGDDHEVFVWQTADGVQVQKLQGNGRSVWAVGWSPDGKTIAWGHTNRGDSRKATAPLEQTFQLDSLEPGSPPTPAFRRAVRSAGGFSLEVVDFFELAIKKDGRHVGRFRSPRRGDRIYSFTVLGGGRAVVGATFGLYLVDLNTGRLTRQFRGHNGMILAVALSPDGRYFLTGSSDQTLCIWRPDREEPLLSFFEAGWDWIAWTPEGYYAASAYGERLMGWQLNRGPEALASFYPASQFRRSLYQPELVQQVLPAGGTREALALLGKDQANALTVAQVLPPAVSLLSPHAGRLAHGGQQVKATAHGDDPHPVTAMRLLVDGRPWQGDKGIRTFADSKAGDAQASWDVDLLPGRHRFEVQAESAVSKALSAPVEVVVAGTDDRPPNLYLVAIGISDYPGELKLRYAAKDARVLSQVFQKQGRSVFGKVEVKLLIDRDATRQNIIEALAWLGSVMTPRDVGILSFSGHGARDPRGRFHLVPVDVRESDPERTCLSGDLVKKALANLPGRLIAILDSCHSGAVAPSPSHGHPDDRPARQARADDLVRDLVSDDYGVVVMCSSLGREFSLEGAEAGHGFFTLGLVEALNGRADFNHDRLIHLHELDVYARTRVRQLSAGMQNPVTGRPPTIRSFPLAGLAAGTP